ncbi:3-methyladenine DNA glycosylase AlkC [Cribrihabitans marinus]|uniref:3-methyladenine DNA glycosylase AlkC n=1 Tax=Cribrihabitans marinus TaxID=1227549 RepID=A0A1H6ZV37_9RHOB|nr:hypothetical protein [Cribrihabitans marinus]GGH29917.1 hypothetical protein GCM10010973_19700 [Cribrihabitans marinus]SEJ57343.1 3-methyladenine DNA glycosylase AlkC [Cribrihabitans marinus]
MAQGFSLKDQLFNAETVDGLAARFAAASPGFDAKAFRAEVLDRFPELELKARIDWIADCLAQQVPGDLDAIAPVILRALPPPCDPARADDDFGEFIYAPLGEWVVKVGLDRPELALDLIEEITQRFSMEWAIRPFLNRWPDVVLARLHAWTDHPHYHVRRLVSEGSRPHLPWGQGIGLTAAQTLPLLDRLHADPTRYVTRSVANHLNDIARGDPDAVLDRLARWRAEGRQDPGELDWMTGHALRGLVKAGHPGAMRMLGYDPDAPVSVTLTLPQSARIGGAFDLVVQLQAKGDVWVLVDYVIHFQRPGGKVSAKVHKLKQAACRGELRLAKTHRLKADATTFRLVPGPHRVEVMVNGRVRASGEVEFVT